MAETITQITQPPEFIEAAGKTYLTDLQKAIGEYKAADLSQTLGPQFVAGLSPIACCCNGERPATNCGPIN